MQAPGGCQTPSEAHFAITPSRSARSVEVPGIWAQDGKYAPKICGHRTRGGCGLPNFLPNVEVRGFT